MKIIKITSPITFGHVKPLIKKDSPYSYPGYPGMIPDDRNPFGGILHNLDYKA